VWNTWINFVSAFKFHNFKSAVKCKDDEFPDLFAVEVNKGEYTR
jgi:hypothetical protein